MAENLLFATLDPTMRAGVLPGFDKVIFSDTVGFVSSLPTQLVAAFRATLEEVTEADVIVHVRDIAHPDTDAQAADVMKVLRDLGVIDGATVTPMLTALNKIDLLPPDARAGLRVGEDSVAISAVTGEGVDALVALIAATLQAKANIHSIRIDGTDGKRLAWLYSHGEVIARESLDDGATLVRVRLSDDDFARFAH
jgi:GTP-binding protein HflX